MGQTVARATTIHNPSSREVEGRHFLNWTGRGGEGIIWESGEGKRRFCGLVIFHTVMSLRGKQLVSLCAHRAHLTRQTTVEPGVDFWVFRVRGNIGFSVSFTSVGLFVLLVCKNGRAVIIALRRPRAYR